MEGLSDEEREIVKIVREFVDRDVKPVVRDLDHSNTYPEKLIETMKELGIFGLAIPQPWGEAKVSTPCYVLVTEELSRGWMSLAGAMGGHTVVAKLIQDYGTQEQKDAYLPRMATGELRATMALTEPGGGSDLQAMRTTATRDGDDYVINGSKTWISNARRSDLIALLCKTDPAARPKHKGVSILLVEKGPGFTLSRDLPKLGYKGVESCEIAFEQMRVPVSSLLGESEGTGFAQMMRGLEVGRLQVAGRALGWGAPHSRTPCGTPRSGRASGCRSGSTSRSATTWPRWSPSSPPPAADPVRRAQVRLRRARRHGGRMAKLFASRPPCRSPWTRCASTVATATPPSSTSSGTSATPA